MSSTKREELTLGLFAILGIFLVAPVTGGLIVATVKLGPASIPIWIAVAAASAFVMKGPMGEALVGRLRGDHMSSELPEETLAELDDLRARVAELEERQDFSDRLLAQKGEPVRLESPRP